MCVICGPTMPLTTASTVCARCWKIVKEHPELTLLQVKELSLKEAAGKEGKAAVKACAKPCKAHASKAPDKKEGNRA